MVRNFSENKETATNGKKILIVDEDRDSLEILNAQFRHADYYIFRAPDILAGEKIALSKIPDLIIMDPELPGNMGITTAQRLNKNPNTIPIPIVACTVWDKDSYKDRARQSGIANYLIKPTSLEMFKDVIERLLQKGVKY